MNADEPSPAFGRSQINSRRDAEAQRKDCNCTRFYPSDTASLREI